jgi:uncharacterized protein YjbI with pentapeptide repeats
MTDGSRDLVIPARTTPAIPIIAPPSLSPATVAWQHKPPRDSITVIVKATFELVPDGPARMRAEADPPTGDVHWDDDPDKSLAYASDFAFFKPKADVTVTGHAHAPGGSAAACRVTLRFGEGPSRIERALHVLGDRVWQRALAVALSPTEPAPFEAMPLVYERAFGGPSHGANPLGTSADRLPNLEDPERPIVGPGDTPPPACFAPVPPTFPPRTGKLGTYDARWLTTRWPYFPEDFDWAHFQSAPTAQQVGWLQGDEPFEITGMRRDHPLVRGRLPGKRVQCFAQHTESSGGALREILLRLDTAAFDMDRMKLSLVWRGLYEVSDEEAPEIATLLVTTSDLRDPAITLEGAQDRLRVAWTPKEPVAMEEPEPPPANDVAPEEQEPDPAIARLEAEQAEREKALLDELRAKGIPVDDPVEPPPPEDPRVLVDRLRAAGMPDEEADELLGVLTGKVDEENKPADLPEPGIRERVIEMLRDGDPLDGEDLAGGDLSDLDFTGFSLERVNLQNANLRRSLFLGANLANAQMAKADLTDADLTDARLHGADLTGSTINGARFEAAEIAHADFSKASGARSDFRRARGDRPSFVGADLTEGSFAAAALPSADFTRATLDRAVFEDASLSEVRLYDVRSEGGRFDRAKMPEARANDAWLVQCSLRSIEASSSEWEGATLDGSTFLGSALAGAGFARTSCHGTVLSAADLRGARFRRAKLANAKLVKANLMRATFERADLTKADLRMANLHEAEVWKATLDGADLDLAIVTQSKLAGRRR